MTNGNYSLTYFNELDEKCLADFKVNEYHNLMELLFDKYMEEWGDCKGRAWCGTCHIKIVKGDVSVRMGHEERNTLSGLYGTTPHSRLACQIPVDEKLNGLVFKILKDDQA